MTRAARARRPLVPGMLAGLLLMLGAACESMPLSTENIGWVATVVDSTTPALSQARTFAVLDTIVPLEGNGIIDHSADKALAQSVRENLLDLGWVENRDSTGVLPDVVVLLGASTSTQTGVAYGGWYGAYGAMPYWGGTADPSWAFGAPVGAVEFTYEVGTVVLTMIDLRAPRAVTKQVPVLWLAALNGVLNGSAVLPRVLDGVDQAFEQSPYLRIP